MLRDESCENQLKLLKSTKTEKYFFHYACQGLTIEYPITGLFFHNINDTSLRSSILTYGGNGEKDIVAHFVKKVGEMYQNNSQEYIFIAWHIDNGGKFGYDVIFERYIKLCNKEYIKIDGNKISLKALKYFLEENTILLEKLILRRYNSAEKNPKIKYIDLFNVNGIKTSGMLKGCKECLLSPTDDKSKIKDSLNSKVAAFIEIINLLIKKELTIPYEIQKSFVSRTLSYIDPKDWLALIIGVAKDGYRAIKE